MVYVDDVIYGCENIAGELGLELYVKSGTGPMTNPIRIAFILEPNTSFVYIVTLEHWGDDMRSAIKTDLEAKISLCNKYEIKRSEDEKPEESKEQTLVDYCKEINKAYLQLVDDGPFFRDDAIEILKSMIGG